MKDPFGTKINVGDEVVIARNVGRSSIEFIKGEVTDTTSSRVYYVGKSDDVNGYSWLNESKDRKTWTYPNRTVVIRGLSWDD